MEAPAPQVLVVDDDGAMRELLRIHLSNAGYAVTAAEDAVAALKCLLRRRPKLMIVDVSMPYMDGLEFVRAVKADASFTGMPIMFLTSREDVDEAARKTGAIACLKKPILAHELIGAVKAALPSGTVGTA